MERHVYRDLLKVIRRHAKGDHFAGFVSQEFRKNTALKDPTDVLHRIDLAKDYSFLVRSVHAHKELLISYNIGVDRDVEQLSRLKNTAERVGLSMPKLFESDKLPKMQDVGKPKAEVAAQRVMQRVKGVTVVPHFCRIEEKDVTFYQDFQIVILGLDSFEVRRYTGTEGINMRTVPHDKDPNCIMCTAGLPLKWIPT